MAIVLAAVCTGALTVTYVRTAHALSIADKKIEDASKNVQQLEHDDDEDESAPAPATSASGAPAPAASTHAE